jgi:fumarate reductase subunit D
MKRSKSPIFWALFGGGGMLAALFGVGLVLVSGIGGPLGWFGNALSYAHMRAFVQNPVGKLFIVAAVALMAWHAAHRILCTLHDVGVHKGLVAKSICYGAALVVTGVAACQALAIGF